MNELGFAVGVLLPKRWRSDCSSIPEELVHQLSSRIEHTIDSLHNDLPLYLSVQSSEPEVFRSFFIRQLGQRRVSTQKLADIPCAGCSEEEIIRASHLLLVLLDPDELPEHPGWRARDLPGTSLISLNPLDMRKGGGDASMAVMDAVHPLALISRQLQHLQNQRRRGIRTPAAPSGLLPEWCSQEEKASLAISEAVFAGVFGVALLSSLSPLLPSTIPLLLVLAAIGLATSRQPWREAVEKWWCIGSLCCIQRMSWRFGLEVMAGNAVQLPALPIDLPRSMRMETSLRRQFNRLSRKQLGNQLLMAHNTWITSLGSSLRWGAAELDDMVELLEDLVLHLQGNQAKALFQKKVALILGIALGSVTLVLSSLSLDAANHLIALLLAVEGWLVLRRPVPVMTVSRRNRALIHLESHLQELRQLRRLDGMTSAHPRAEQVRELMQRIAQEWQDLVHDSICSSSWAS